MWVLHSSLYCLALWRYRRRNPSKSRPLYDWTTAIVWCPTFNFHFTFGRNNTYFLWHSNKMNVLTFTIMWCICCSYGCRLIVSLMCVCVCVCVKIQQHEHQTKRQNPGTSHPNFYLWAMWLCVSSLIFLTFRLLSIKLLLTYIHIHINWPTNCLSWRVNVKIKKNGHKRKFFIDYQYHTKWK